MKPTFDLTRSKRPILEHDEGDILKAEQLEASLKAEIASLDRKIRSKDCTPEYKQVVIDSYERMKEIAWKRMFHDTKDTAWHLTVVGQFNERLKITQELVLLGRQKKSAENRIDKIRGIVLRLKQKLGLREAKTDNVN